MSTNSENRITIVLATGNRDKVREIRPLLENISPLIEIFCLRDLGAEIEVDETEETLEGNALLKAKAIFSHLAGRFRYMIALADDTGLEVDSLQGAPGVYSARYAPMPDHRPPAYEDNVRYLLERMQGIENRKAYFRTVIALKGCIPSAGGDFSFEHTCEGSVSGTITQERKGGEGFGYDPVFMVDGTGRTYAEMSIAEKNSLSHRALAVRKAVTDLNNILQQSSSPNRQPEKQ
ncbi:MAG: RdgB/HAM1 family non-canonical purine NTP pyrophosphatase [Chlorobiaceae bacterium]|jgi:XTP/dITP diphosphohydrolase|nr:RdgB/HAM1 family non-canonical purine NTP pyrophosphatase [Chlorobiaceae bacterium]